MAIFKGGGTFKLFSLWHGNCLMVLCIHKLLWSLSVTLVTLWLADNGTDYRVTNFCRTAAVN